MTPALTPFFPRIFDNGCDGLIIDGDHRQRDFPWHFENARIAFSPKTSGRPGLMGMMRDESNPMFCRFLKIFTA